MAKQAFLDGLRVARNLFIHPGIEAENSHGDSAEKAQRLARSAIWLTPKSVKEFCAADFAELGPERQRDLEAAAQGFLQVAKQVPADQPATVEQYGKGATAFKKIVEILEPYLATPDEGTLVAKVLQSMELPPWVLNWDYKFDTDSEGDPLVLVILYVDYEAATRMDIARFSTKLTINLRHALTAVGVMRWPFVRVRTEQEFKSAIR